MSDAIVRLKVESQEYDQKLKRATEGLTRYADECRKVGGTLEVVEKETLDYVRALGKMDTVAKTTNGSLSEMKKAYTELSMQYRKMTDEEKKGEYGQAIRHSLDQLRGRIKDTEGDLKGINNELTGSSGLSGALDSVTGKLGINIKQLTLWGAALGAGKVALDVAKDAFFASEATVDEWGRTVAASESVYQGFLNAINTGDISGYLNHIDDIVKAARIAYDELDRLGTMQRIQSPQKSAQQTENERMRMMIQTGRYIAPVDGRGNAVFNGRVMQNGDKLTAGQIRAIERQLQGGLQKTTKLIENEVKQTTKAISALYDRQSKELGLSRKEFMAGTSSMAEFDKRIAGYQQYQQWRSQHTTIDQQSGREIVARGNPYQEYAKWGTFRVDGDRYNQLVQLVLQRDQQAAQAYSMQGQTYRTINRAEGFNVRQLLGTGGGTGGSGGGGSTPVPVEIKNFEPTAAAAAGVRGVDTMPSIFGMLKDSGAAGINAAMGSISPELSADIEKQQALVDELREKWAEAGGELRDSYIAQIIDAEDKLRSLKEEQDVSTRNTPQFDAKQDISKQWKTGKNGQLAQQGQSLAEDGRNVAAEWQSAASAISAVGAAMSQIEDPAAKVMGTIAQAIATIALTFASSLKGTVTPWDWIAAAASGTATMISTISAIHSATGYANGGIVGRAGGGFVPGNQMSGDNVLGMVDGVTPVGLNSGELVLNKAQQANLAENLTRSEGAGGNGLARISGEQIYIAISNYLRRSGKGELVTWR